MADLTTRQRHYRLPANGLAEAVPPHAYFATSAIFHYLGPSFAVLLFTQVSALGVLWLRVAVAAAIFALWRRPWQSMDRWTREQTRVLVGLGIVLGLMNASFYLAIERLPLGTVGAIEFLGPVAIAASGARGRRNKMALGLAIAGALLLADIQVEAEPVGLLFALANCGFFTLYILLGHRVARVAGSPADRLGAAMLVALLVVTPLGLLDALPALIQPPLLLAGIGVGLCSSVIPYVCDQLAMARLPRSTFALMLALLPACAAGIGFLVLRQIPRPAEMTGIALIVMAIALHVPGEG